MIPQKSPEDIKAMRAGGRGLAKILQELAGEVKPGVSGQYLNTLCEKLIDSFGGKPSFKGYVPGGVNSTPYPAALCCSINNEVVHGIPQAGRIVKDGDIVSLDVGLYYCGFHTDSAVTVGVGNISKDAQKLLKVTKEALQRGMRELKPGATIGNIGAAIQKHAQASGFGVVKSLVGHGVGRELHEPPRVPNFGQRGEGARLKVGHVLAIEPMVNIGQEDVETKDDGWTIVTSDGSLSAHFEHTVAVVKNGYEILTLPE